MVEGINAIFAGWYGFPRPVVAAVNGHAIAGGLILALCADYRVGSTEGKYGVTELKAGLSGTRPSRWRSCGPSSTLPRRGGSCSAPTSWARRRRSRRAPSTRSPSPTRCSTARPRSRATVAPAAGGLREGQAAAARPVLEAALAQPDPLLEGFAGAQAAGAKILRREQAWSASAGSRRPADADDELAEVSRPMWCSTCPRACSTRRSTRLRRAAGPRGPSRSGTLTRARS